MRQMGGAEDYTPGRTADGIEAIAQRAYHILDTPPGGLPQDPEWGWGLRDLIGQGLVDGDLRVHEAIGRAAFKRDPEILDADVAITLAADGHGTIRALLTTTLGETTIEATT